MYNHNGELTEVCHKYFPKEHSSETVWDSKIYYVKYKRRTVQEGGDDAFHNYRILDSSWVVPYSPYLLLKYNCHLNVEMCVSYKATKYLYKYVHKGGDRAMLKVDDNSLFRNEVKEYQDMRSIGAPEGQ